MLLTELVATHTNGVTEIFVGGDDLYSLLVAPTAGLSGLGIDTTGGVVITREGARVLAPLAAAALDIALDSRDSELVRSLASVQQKVKSKL